jgi:hypothetical protein
MVGEPRAWRMAGGREAVGGAGGVAGVGPRHEVVRRGGSGRGRPSGHADLLAGCEGRHVTQAHFGAFLYCTCGSCWLQLLTVLKHPLHVESVSGAGLVVSTPVRTSHKTQQHIHCSAVWQFSAMQSWIHKTALKSRQKNTATRSLPCHYYSHMIVSITAEYYRLRSLASFRALESSITRGLLSLQASAGVGS